MESMRSKKTRCFQNNGGTRYKHGRERENFKEGENALTSQSAEVTKTLVKEGELADRTGSEFGSERKGKGRMNGSVRNARGNARSHGEKDKPGNSQQAARRTRWGVRGTSSGTHGGLPGGPVIFLVLGFCP